MGYFIIANIFYIFAIVWFLEREFKASVCFFCLAEELSKLIAAHVLHKHSALCKSPTPVIVALFEIPTAAL